MSFLGGIQHCPVKGCSAASCYFGVLTGDEYTSYSAISNHSVESACVLAFLFSPSVRILFIKMQKLCFFSFLFLSFALLHPAKRMIQWQLSQVTYLPHALPTPCPHQEKPPEWFLSSLTIPEAWSTEQETDCPCKSNVCVPWPLETTTSFNAVDLSESRLGAHVWAHVVWFWSSVCVCVFPQEILPSYTAQVNCPLYKDFSSPLHTGYTLPDSSLNSATPQIWLKLIFLRWRQCWDKWPKLLTSSVEKPDWEPRGGPNVAALDPWPAFSLSRENLRHGARGSLHLHPCLEVLAAPEVQILPIIVR